VKTQLERMPWTVKVWPYCKGRALLVGGLKIYPHRQDLKDKKFYLCGPCNAYVGCHPGTTNALGRLANAELREAKMAAHAAFDPIWKTGQKKRGGAYAWLCDQLGIEKKDCHIGMFDVEMCKRVVAACKQHNVQGEGRCAALSRSAPSTEGLCQTIEAEKK